MKILVTGATGFLGRQLVAELAPRHQLRLLLRPTARREGFPDGVELATGDVTDRASIARALAGDAGSGAVDAVLHAAALVKVLAPDADYDRVNVEGTRNVLDAAAAAGVARITYVSSFMALGPTEGGPGRTLDESAPPDERRWINAYERTKTRADRLARERVAAGAPLSVVYPGVIYGRGEMTEGNIVVRSLLDLLHGKVPALVGDLERRWSYAYVDDVARGVARVVEEAPVGSRYALGGENVRLRDFYALVGELGGARLPSLRLPTPVAKGIGAAMRGWARLTGGVPQLTPDLVEVCLHDWALDSSKAARELGYRPRSLREGLTTTLDWLRESGQWRT